MSSGRELAHRNDDVASMPPNFLVPNGKGFHPGRLYLQVKGATPQAEGEYFLGILVYTQGAAKPVAAQELERRFSK